MVGGGHKPDTCSVLFTAAPSENALLPVWEEVNPIMHWAESCQATALSTLTLGWVNRLVTSKRKEKSEVTWKLLIFKR